MCKLWLLEILPQDAFLFTSTVSAHLSISFLYILLPFFSISLIFQIVKNTFYQACLFKKASSLWSICPLRIEMLKFHHLWLQVINVFGPGPHCPASSCDCEDLAHFLGGHTLLTCLAPASVRIGCRIGSSLVLFAIFWEIRWLAKPDKDKQMVFWYKSQTSQGKRLPDLTT